MKNLIWPNKETKIFISMAKNPGNTGAGLHNSLFKIFKLNNIYLPLKIENVSQARQILKHFNFQGCSLSMPYKEKLINFVDKLENNAKKIGSINTVLKKNNTLIGFNTDYYASKEILKKKNLSKNFNILLLGCGGVAKAVLYALNNLKFKNIFLSTRSKKKFNELNIKQKITFVPWNTRHKMNADVIINTTPLGMFGKLANKIPIRISKDYLPKLIYDFPVNSKGNLLYKFAKKNKIEYVSGLESSYYQGVKQFEIYNNEKVNKKNLNILRLSKFRFFS
tara:strand:- start:35947 stop:36783 length:837 start_codon:yes stop_codon:yes gene_type:complete